MRAVDTNVLIRLVTRDDAKQLAAATAFVARGAWVSHLVLLETTWVLASAYGMNRDDLAFAVESLLDHAQMAVEGADIVEAALERYRKHPAVSFSDSLILEVARRAGHVPLGTFDKALSRVEGAVTP